WTRPTRTPRTTGSGRRDAVDAGERLRQRGVVAGCEHERRLLVHRRELEHRGRRGTALLERLPAAPRRRADPAVQLLARQPPALARERQRRPARHLAGLLAHRSREPGEL